MGTSFGSDWNKPNVLFYKTRKLEHLKPEWMFHGFKNDGEEKKNEIFGHANDTVKW